MTDLRPMLADIFRELDITPATVGSVFMDEETKVIDVVATHGLERDKRLSLVSVLKDHYNASAVNLNIPEAGV